MMQNEETSQKNMTPFSPHLTAVCVGLPRPLTIGGKQVLTCIFKEPVSGPVRVGRLGLTRDEQVDRRYHGGVDKAVNVYSADHFDYWSERLGRPIEPGAFGENLTIAGCREEDVAIGDVLTIGTARLQVTQPRQPCGTLAAKFGEKMLVRWVNDSGKTGFYLRCLEPGEVSAGDVIEWLERAEPRISVAEANDIMLCAKDDPEAVDRLVAIEALSDAWRTDLSARKA